MPRKRLFPIGKWSRALRLLIMVSLVVEMSLVTKNKKKTRNKAHTIKTIRTNLIPNFLYHTEWSTKRRSPRFQLFTLLFCILYKVNIFVLFSHACS